MSENDRQKKSYSVGEFSELGGILRGAGSYGSTQDESVGLLLEAISANDLDEVRRLVDAGVDVNARYCSHGIWCSGDEFVSPLIAAAETKGSVEIVRFLLSRGADPTLGRELREDVGYSDYKWEGLGKYETPIDLASNNPEVQAVMQQFVRDAK